MASSRLTAVWWAHPLQFKMSFEMPATGRPSSQPRDEAASRPTPDGWSLAEQERFMAALAGGCISSPETREYLLTEMGQVTSDPWGFGSVGVAARWKGGWGQDRRSLSPAPDGHHGPLGPRGCRDHRGTPDNGDFASGQEDASEVAQWVAERAGSL